MTFATLRGFGLALALALAAPAAALAQSGDDAATIRSLRRASNTALRTADLDAFMLTIDTDYVGTAGNGGHVRSREELRALIDGVFREAPGRYFVRTANDVEVVGTRAMEVGRWIAIEPGPDGTSTPGVGGRYTAYWRRADEGWRIHAEIFVTLDSPGGATS